MNASGVPAMDGAFERFITAAIATIITIMFSWRLLTDVNEYDSVIPIISPPPLRLKHLTEEDNQETDDSNDYDNFSDADDEDEATIEPATRDFASFAFAIPKSHSSYNIPGLTTHATNIPALQLSDIHCNPTTENATYFIDDNNYYYHQQQQHDHHPTTRAICSSKTDNIPGGCVKQQTITYQHDDQLSGGREANISVATATCTTTTVAPAAAVSKDSKVSSKVSHPIVDNSSQTGKTVFILGSASPLQQVVSPPLVASVNNNTTSNRVRRPLSSSNVQHSHSAERLSSDEGGHHHNHNSLMTTTPRFSSQSSHEAPTPCLSTTSTTVSCPSLPQTTTSRRGPGVRPPPPPLPPRRPQLVTHTTTTNNTTITTTTNTNASTNDRNTTTTITNTPASPSKSAAAPILGRRAMANNNNRNNVANKNESSLQSHSNSSSSSGSSSSSSTSSTSSLVCNREFRNIVDDDDFKQMVPSREISNFFRPRHRYIPQPPSSSNYFDIDSDSDSDSEVFYFYGLEPIEEEDSDDLSSDSDRCDEYEVKGDYPPSLIYRCGDDGNDNNSLAAAAATTTTTTTNNNYSTNINSSSISSSSSHSLTGVPARGGGTTATTSSLLFPSYPGDVATTTTSNNNNSSQGSNRTALLLPTNSNRSGSSSSSASSSPRQHGRSFSTENNRSNDYEPAKNYDGSSADTSFTSPYSSCSEEFADRDELENGERRYIEEGIRVTSMVECDQPSYADNDTCTSTTDNNNYVTYTHATAIVEQAPIIRPPKQLFNISASTSLLETDYNTQLTTTTTVLTPEPTTTTAAATVDNVISIQNIPVEHVCRDNNNCDMLINDDSSTVYTEELSTSLPTSPPTSDQQQQSNTSNEIDQFNIIDPTDKQQVRSTEELSNSLKKSSVAARPLSQTIGDLSDTSRDLTTYNENALLSFTTSSNERSQRIKDDSVNPTQTPVNKSRERSYSDGDVNQDEETSSSPSESTHGLMLDIRANSTTKEETNLPGDEFIIIGKNVSRDFQNPSPDAHYINWPVQLYFDARKSNAAENPPRGFTFSYSEPSETAYNVRNYYVENYDNNSNTLNNNSVSQYGDNDSENMLELTENNNLSADNLKFTQAKDYVDNSLKWASDDINVFTTSKLDNGPVVFKRALSTTNAEERESSKPDNYISLEQQNIYLASYKEPGTLDTVSPLDGLTNQVHKETEEENKVPMPKDYIEQEALENILHYDGLTEKDLYINKYSDYVVSDYVTLDTMEKSYPDILKKGSFTETGHDINSNDYIIEEGVEDDRVFPDLVKKDTYPINSSSSLQRDNIDRVQVSTFPDVVNKGTIGKTQDVMCEDFTVLECKEKRPFPDIVEGQAYHVDRQQAELSEKYSIMQETVEKTGFPDIVNREEFHLDRDLKETQFIPHEEVEEDINKKQIPVDSTSENHIKQKPSYDSVKYVQVSNPTEVSHLEVGTVVKTPTLIKPDNQRSSNLFIDAYSVDSSVDPVRKITTTQHEHLPPNTEIRSHSISKTEPTTSEDLVTSIDSEVEFEVFKSECLAHSEDYNSLYSLDKLDMSGKRHSNQQESSSNKTESDNYDGSLSLEEYDELTDLVSDQLTPSSMRTSALHRPLTVNTSGIPGNRQVPMVRRKINAVRKRYFGSENNVSDLVEDENSVNNKFARYRKTSLRALKRRDAAKRYSLHHDQVTLQASKIRPSKSLSHISQLYLRSEPASRYRRPTYHEVHPDCILSPGNADNLVESIQAASIDNLETCLSQYDSFCSLVETDIDTGETTERRFSLDNEVFEIPFSFQRSYFGKSTSLMDLRSEQQQVRRSTGKGRFADRNVPKSKSMQTLETNLDDDDDEDDLLGESGFRRVPSIHELRVSRSLQKLNVPAWYKNSSVSRSGSCILNRDADSMRSFDWRFNASVTSSPASSIINHQAPVVIKTRVMPSYTRSHSAPIKSPKLVLPSKPANVKLPSDQFRNQEKPKGLMPIPIVPFLKIREMFEKKSQENNSQPAFPTLISPVSKTPVKTAKPEPPKRITPVKRAEHDSQNNKKSPVSPGFSPALRIDEAIEETNEEEEEEEEEYMEDCIDALTNVNTSTQPSSTPVKYNMPTYDDFATVTLNTAPPLINGDSQHVRDSSCVSYNNNTTTTTTSVESDVGESNKNSHKQYHTVDDAAPIICRPVARRPAEIDSKQQQLVNEPTKATTSESKPPSTGIETENGKTQDNLETNEKSRKVVKVSERIQLYDQASSSKEPEKSKASKEKDWKPKLFSFRDNKVAKSQPKQTPPQPPPKAKLPVPFFRNRKETTV